MSLVPEFLYNTQVQALIVIVCLLTVVVEIIRTHK